MKFTFILIALILLSGCKSIASNADDIARNLQKVEDELRLLKKYEQLAKQAREAGQFSQAEQYGDEARKSARRINVAAQESDQISRAGSLSEDAQSLLQRIQEANIQAQFVRLQTESDKAVGLTTIKMKFGQGALANEDIKTLRDFNKEFLCFHLETLVNENRLPSDADYKNFVLDSTLSKIVPVWELKGKAESIIEFAKTASVPHSSAETQARLRLLRECSFH